jgi:hypothetical protein
VSCHDSPASVTKGYVFCDISLHTIPPISGFQILVHLGTAGMDGVG